MCVVLIDVRCYHISTKMFHLTPKMSSFIPRGKRVKDDYSRKRLKEQAKKEQI
jgi:hypothetical protein